MHETRLYKFYWFENGSGNLQFPGPQPAGRSHSRFLYSDSILLMILVNPSEGSQARSTQRVSSSTGSEVLGATMQGVTRSGRSAVQTQKLGRLSALKTCGFYIYTNSAVCADSAVATHFHRTDDRGFQLIERSPVYLWLLHSIFFWLKSGSLAPGARPKPRLATLRD